MRRIDAMGGYLVKRELDPRADGAIAGSPLGTGRARAERESCDHRHNETRKLHQTSILEPEVPR